MEALELWHAECLERLPRVTLSPRELRHAREIPLATLRWSARAAPARGIGWRRRRSNGCRARASSAAAAAICRAP
jgi:hypothetical protein